mmetsp:Transcript_11921/g.27963  ORF Transcript_11921/g.27963 Transcript_11921/m.27963 type:complete len:257 (+) Transcript_11921:648-1418(+)
MACSVLTVRSSDNRPGSFLPLLLLLNALQLASASHCCQRTIEVSWELGFSTCGALIAMFSMRDKQTVEVQLEFVRNDTIQVRVRTLTRKRGGDPTILFADSQDVSVNRKLRLQKCEEEDAANGLRAHALMLKQLFLDLIRTAVAQKFEIGLSSFLFDLLQHELHPLCSRLGKTSASYSRRDSRRIGALCDLLPIRELPLKVGVGALLIRSGRVLAKHRIDNGICYWSRFIVDITITSGESKSSFEVFLHDFRVDPS